MGNVNSSKLFKLLSNVDDITFEQIYLRISLAKIIRDYVNALAINIVEMCERYGWSEDFYRNMITGAYDFDLKTLSEFEVFFSEKAGEPIKIFTIP